MFAVLALRLIGFSNLQAAYSAADEAISFTQGSHSSAEKYSLRCRYSPIETLTDISDAQSIGFTALLNEERVVSKAGAENMGCMTWDAEMVKIAKTTQKDCIIDSSGGNRHGFVLMSSTESILNYPRVWATQDSDFDYENMKCKQATKECMDFMQVMYYKRGKVGCVKCEGQLNTIICAFEHKVPETGLPNRKGTPGTRCEEGERSTKQKCCAASSKNGTKKEEPGSTGVHFLAFTQPEGSNLRS